MSDKKISQLSNGSAITGAEQVPVVQSGSTVKTTINAIKTFFDTIYTTTSAVASQITTALSGYVNTSGLTTNYIPKASDSDTLTNSLIQDNGSGVGVNTSPLANTTLGVVGSDSTLNNFAAKIRSSSADIAVFRNDGRLTLSVANNTNDFPLVLTSSNTNLSRIQHINGGGVQTDIQFGNNNGSNSFYFGVTSGSKPFLDNRTTQNFEFQINGTQKIIIDTSGNLKIDNLTASQIVETDASKNLISAAKGTAYNKNFGTTAGTVLEGNAITQTITNGVTDKAPSEDAVFDALALKKDTLIWQSSSAGNLAPADATTYYFSNGGITPNTTATNFQFTFGFNFRVIGAIIPVTNAGTTGSGESGTINLRNITQATSSLISNSITTNVASTQVLTTTVTGLNITGLATDNVAIEFIAPTYATNPTNVNIPVRLIIERT